MKRALVALLCIAVGVMGCPLGGAAQGRGRARAIGPACGIDHQRFCRDVPPGGGRIIVCLNEHVDKVSQPCFQALASWGLSAVSALKMCQPDVERLCAFTPGPRRAFGCLIQNADKLSATCRDALRGQDLLDDDYPGPRR